MYNRILLVIMLVHMMGCSTSDTTRTDIGKKRKAVIVILDGIPADVIERVETPNLDDIASTGGYGRATTGGQVGHISETPTVSAVGYNSLITGVWAHKHNVYGNGIHNPNYRYWNIFRILESNDSSFHSAIFSTWEDNRTKLLGEGRPEAGNIQIDYSFDGFEFDTLRFPHDLDRQYIYNIDELVSTEAGSYISENGPDISWVYLEFTDDMGHKFGDGKEMDRAVRIADFQVGRLWDAVLKRQQEDNEEWMILITTDHGRKEQDGKGHGGQSERERTIWYFTNIDSLNQRFYDTPEMVDGIPSMLRFLDVNVPQDLLNESDGVPFIGDISLGNARGVIQDNQLKITWKSYSDDGNIKISISETDKFKTGSSDSYIEIEDVPNGLESANINISEHESDTLKVLLEGQFNTTNIWVIRN